MKAAVFPDQCDSMFCAGSNPGRSVLVFRDGEDL